MKRYTSFKFDEEKIPKAPAYWIDPIGHILPIFDDEKHIGVILKKPSAFGLDIDEIKMLYDTENEQLGDEGKAREKIIKELLQRGWIRIRHYPRQDIFTVNVFQLKKKAKDNLYRWSKAMCELGGAYSQVKIDTPTGVIHSSVGDIANDVLFTESKNSKHLIVIKDVNDLPDIKIESIFKENTKYIDFSKNRDKVFLKGFIKDREFNVMCFWDNDFTVRCIEIEKGLHSMIYNKNNRSGGSPAQLLSALFLTIFKISVPKIDNGGSGLDVNLMLDTLVKKYKFTIDKG